MAAEGGHEDDRLSEVLRVARKFGRGNFHTLVAFIERMAKAKVRVGGDGPVRDEPIRFRHDPSLAFSKSDVTELELSDGSDSSGKTFEITTSFLGLTGTVTPLPTYFCTEVAQNLGDNGVLQDFLDVFHHRILSLFYRSTSRYNYATEFSSDGKDQWSERLLAFAGIEIGTAEPAIPRWRLLRLMPLLVRSGSSTWALRTALEDVLEDHLDGASIEIEQFVGNLVEIAVSQQIRLGVDNCNLGTTTVLGERAYDRTGKFNIVIGPLSAEAYNRFQSDEEVRQLISGTVGLFCRDPLDYDLALVLGEETIPGLRLSASSPSKLGIDTFLGSQGQNEITVSMSRQSEMQSAASL